MQPYTSVHAGNKSGLTGLKEHMKWGGKNWGREWEDLEGRECGVGRGWIWFKKYNNNFTHESFNDFSFQIQLEKYISQAHKTL